MRSRISSARLLIGLCLSFSFLMSAEGCKSRKNSVDHAEVTGKVLFKGAPLPGGRVTFVATQGGFSSTGTIDENGNYKISAPVGAVLIAVDNEDLLKQRGTPQMPRLKRPDSEEATPMKGRYVSIPPKYASADSSKLTYEVKSGAQTHDIELDDKRF